MSEEADRALIDELARILWMLERRGYIQNDDPEDEQHIEYMRFRARDAVRRARVRLGLSEGEKP